MREKDIESWSKRLARAKGWLVYKFTSPGKRSVPDDIFIKQRRDGSPRIFMAEAKATGEVPTALQLDEHELLRAEGVTVYVYDSRELFAEILAQEEAML